MPRFVPPKQTYKDAVAATLDIIETRFKDSSVVKLLVSTFQKVGLTESLDSCGKPYYVNYVAKKGGSIKVCSKDISTMDGNSISGFMIDFVKREEDADDFYADEDKIVAKPNQAAVEHGEDQDDHSESSIDHDDDDDDDDEDSSQQSSHSSDISDDDEDEKEDETNDQRSDSSSEEEVGEAGVETTHYDSVTNAIVPPVVNDDCTASVAQAAKINNNVGIDLSAANIVTGKRVRYAATKDATSVFEGRLFQISNDSTSKRMKEQFNKATKTQPTNFF